MSGFWHWLPGPGSPESSPSAAEESPAEHGAERASVMDAAMSADRTRLLILAAGFCGFHLIPAALTLHRAASPGPVQVAIALYVLCSVLCVLPGWRRGIPAAVAWPVLAGTVLITSLVTSQLTGSEVNGYATWHVAAVGTLLVILLVRGQELVAWIGMAFLILQSVLWAGPAHAVLMGVPGSAVWVISASLLTHSMVRLSRDNLRLARAERQTTRLRALREAHRRERLLRLRQTESRAVPMLRLIVESDGVLDVAARRECVLLEAALRDEIRGRVLLNERVRASAQEARRRGVIVQMLDEGTLDGLGPEELHRIAESVADALDAMVTETVGSRVVVRTGIGSTAVTVVGLARDRGSNEDRLVLRRSIPREDAPSAGEPPAPETK